MRFPALVSACFADALFEQVAGIQSEDLAAAGLRIFYEIIEERPLEGKT
jgi:hypothetical protein